MARAPKKQASGKWRMGKAPSRSGPSRQRRSWHESGRGVNMVGTVGIGSGTDGTGTIGRPWAGDRTARPYPPTTVPTAATARPTARTDPSDRSPAVRPADLSGRPTVPTVRPPPKGSSPLPGGNRSDRPKRFFAFPPSGPLTWRIEPCHGGDIEGFDRGRDLSDRGPSPWDV